jgi:class 3 adenylate cyclase
MIAPADEPLHRKADGQGPWPYWLGGRAATIRARNLARRLRVSLYSDGEEQSVRVHSVERKLAAILAADVVGYSRLMGEDEAGTLARLTEHRRELIDPKISEHKGRIVKTTGDGILIEFPSVVEAVACAVAVPSPTSRRSRRNGSRRPQAVIQVSIKQGR